MLSGRHALAKLVDEVVPFWIEHGVDREFGGVVTSLDRDGTVLDHDKGVWQQFRFVWLLARCCRVIGSRPEWVEALDRVFDFARAHAFDTDGRMFFHLDREGRPIRRRRYVYSECFASMAFAEVAALRSDPRLAREAGDLLRFARMAMTTPGSLESKTTSHRQTRSLGNPMIILGVAQVHRDSIGGEQAEDIARSCASEIRRDFVRPELEAVLEVVSSTGEVVDHLEGRQLNPGHAFEGAWFMLLEARRHEDPDLLQAGIDMLEWSWKRGWDQVHGGILNFVDLHGGPTAAYEHDMKFWWPQCEAILAARHAHAMTGAPRHREMAEQAETWAMEHFEDPVHPEWFGYLHRDGSRSSRVKGNLWKGPFHLPRMLLSIATLDRTLDPPVPDDSPLPEEDA